MTNSPGGDYQHWGMVSSGAARTVLPDNAGGGEWCGGASLGFAYDDAWGWDDRDCGVAQSFMCRCAVLAGLLCWIARQERHGVPLGVHVR